MKRYPQIVSQLFYRPLVITRAKHYEICRVLEAHLAQTDPEDLLDDMDEDDDPEPDWQTYGPDAIIPVHGILGKHLTGLDMMSGGCDVDMVSSMIDLAMDDAEVKKIIFDFRTPGGSVTGIPELADKIAAITSKDTVAFSDSECCSGGVWLATQCQHFYTTRSASVGSIGVWCAYLDMSRQMQNEGENMQAIFAGKYKLLGAYWKPMTDEERAMVQSDVDKIYQQFRESVNSRREISDENMQGQIFDGEDAVECGLCDGIIEGIDDLLYQEESDPAQ